jgi:hypothetical protein
VLTPLIDLVILLRANWAAALWVEGFEELQAAVVVPQGRIVALGYIPENKRIVRGISCVAAREDSAVRSNNHSVKHREALIKRITSVMVEVLPNC